MTGGQFPALLSRPPRAPEIAVFWCRMSDGSAPAFPLAMAQEGEQVRVVRLGRGERMARRLSALGLCPGTEAVMLKRGGQGPVLIAVGDTRLAIGLGMAGHVLVELIEGNDR